MAEAQPDEQMRWRDEPLFEARACSCPKTGAIWRSHWQQIQPPSLSNLHIKVGCTPYFEPIHPCDFLGPQVAEEPEQRRAGLQLV